MLNLHLINPEKPTEVVEDIWPKLGKEWGLGLTSFRRKRPVGREVKRVGVKVSLRDGC